MMMIRNIMTIIKILFSKKKTHKGICWLLNLRDVPICGIKFCDVLMGTLQRNWNIGWERVVTVFHLQQVKS